MASRPYTQLSVETKQTPSHSLTLQYGEVLDSQRQLILAANTKEALLVLLDHSQSLLKPFIADLHRSNLLRGLSTFPGKELITKAELLDSAPLYSVEDKLSLEQLRAKALKYLDVQGRLCGVGSNFKEVAEGYARRTQEVELGEKLMRFETNWGYTIGDDVQCACKMLESSGGDPERVVRETLEREGIREGDSKYMAWLKEREGRWDRWATGETAQEKSTPAATDAGTPVTELQEDKDGSDVTLPVNGESGGATPNGNGLDNVGTPADISDTSTTSDSRAVSTFMEPIGNEISEQPGEDKGTIPKEANPQRLSVLGIGSVATELLKDLIIDTNSAQLSSTTDSHDSATLPDSVEATLPEQRPFSIGASASSELDLDPAEVLPSLKRPRRQLFGRQAWGVKVNTDDDVTASDNDFAGHVEGTMLEDPQTGTVSMTAVYATVFLAGATGSVALNGETPCTISLDTVVDQQRMTDGSIATVQSRPDETIAPLGAMGPTLSRDLEAENHTAATVTSSVPERHSEEEKLEQRQRGSSRKTVSWGGVQNFVSTGDSRLQDLAGVLNEGSETNKTTDLSGAQETTQATGSVVSGKTGSSTGASARLRAAFKRVWKASSTGRIMSSTLRSSKRR